MTNHSTRPNAFVVDIGVVRSNVETIRAAIGNDRVVIASLKADAYGFGAVEVAAATAAGGAIGVAVGDFETAVTLRHNGIAGVILVYAGPLLDASDLDAASHERITLTVQDAIAAAQLDQRASAPIEVFLEVDVGHERLGVRPEEAATLARTIASSRHLRLVGLLSHLFTSPEMGDGRVQRQLDRLGPALDALEAADLLPVHRVAESTGVLARGSAVRIDARLNCVDPGRLVLGMGAEPRGPAVRPAFVALTSRIIQLKSLTDRDEDEPAPRSDQVTRIGVLPVGRADGLAALAVGHVLVRGHRAPVIGTWIEHTTIDVTSIPEAEPGDDVVLIGRQGSAQIRVDDVLDAQPRLREVDLGLNVRPSVVRRYVGDGRIATDTFGGADRMNSCTG